MKNEYGNWLPYDTEEEREEAIKWLRKWANHYCYRVPYQSEADANDPKLFEYYPVEEQLICQPSLSTEKIKTGTIAIRFKVAKRYLDEN